MNEIITTLDVLRPALCSRTMRQLILIVDATLAMTGRVTMLGISRWTEIGGSYRTVQRFFKGEYNWSKLRWLLIKQHLGSQFEKVFILVADEVVVTKSGKHTHGLGNFFHLFKAKQYAAYVLLMCLWSMLNHARHIHS
jgi:putative transposase